MPAFLLAALLLAPIAATAQPTPPAPPPQEDCGCGVPSSPRGPR